MTEQNTNLDGMSQKDILERRRQINEKFGANVFTTGKNKKAEAMMAEMNGGLDVGDSKSVANVSNDYRTVKLSEIDIHPCNMRSPLDYLDRSFDDKIDLSGGLIKDPVVSSRVIKREDGTEYHPIIAGNRSVQALRRVVQERWKQNPDDFEIRVKFRDYGKDPRLAVSQELVDLQVDNDTHMKPSVLDQLKMVRHYEDLGFSNAKIAEVMNKNLSTLSIIRSFELLPERIKTLVDAEMKRDYYINVSVSELNAHRIPYTVNKETGEVSLRGISYNKAKLMLRYFPATSLRRSDPSEYNQRMLDAEDFVLCEEIMEAALDPQIYAPQFEELLASVAQKRGGTLPDFGVSKNKATAKSVTQTQSEPLTPIVPPAPVATAPAVVSDPAPANPIAARLAQQAAKMEVAQPMPTTQPMASATEQPISKPAASAGEVDALSAESVLKKLLAQFQNKTGMSYDHFTQSVNGGLVAVHEDIVDNIKTDAKAPAHSRADTAMLLLFMFENGLVDLTRASDEAAQAVFAKLVKTGDADFIRNAMSLVDRAWIDVMEE